MEIFYKIKCLIVCTVKNTLQIKSVDFTDKNYQPERQYLKKQLNLKCSEKHLGGIFHNFSIVRLVLQSISYKVFP